MHMRKLSRSLKICLFHEYLLKHTASRWCHVRTSEREDIRLKKVPNHMSAWQVTSFANGGKIEFSKNVPVPIISHPHHILVKVTHASVNPLDVEMIRGFGRVLLKNMRFLSSVCGKTNDSSYELPIILGRDFSGTIVAKGSSVTQFNIGDVVFGVVKPQYNGCHAEYALTYDSLVLKKPKELSSAKASGILYTTLTAWSALRFSGHMLFDFSTKYPVLVIGASGGVGLAAIQLLKAWNCNVVATCRTDAIPVVEKFSPNIIIDYTSPEYLTQVEEACNGFVGKYFLILDAAGLPDDELLKYRRIVDENGTIVTLRSPLLSNVDQYGLVGGGLKTFADIILLNMNFGSTIATSKLKWAYFTTSQAAMEEIAKLVLDQKLNSEIEKVYDFSNADQAYARMKAGHLRGKIVLSLNGRSAG